MKDELGVLVGYDDAPSAKEALRWAIAEAADRKLPLTVCHAWEWSHHEWPGELVPLGLVRRPAQRLVKAAAGWVGRHYPDVAVNTLTDRGTASALLTDLSSDAALIVVGTRGHGTLGGLVAGSVSGHVAAHASCPVIVIRGHPQARGARDVVVGFDASPASMAALAFAAGEAARLGASLKALIAHLDQSREASIRAEGLAWEELISWQRRYPDLHAGVELPHRL